MKAARERAERIAEDGRRIQAQVDKTDKGKSPESKKPMQAGQREYPSQFPAEHQEKPGTEAESRRRTDV